MESPNSAAGPGGRRGLSNSFGEFVPRAMETNRRPDRESAKRLVRYLWVGDNEALLVSKVAEARERLVRADAPA